VVNNGYIPKTFNYFRGKMMHSLGEEGRRFFLKHTGIQIIVSDYVLYVGVNVWTQRT
jgi:hypothetical protein